MKEIWVEKYRPKTLSEVVGQEEIVERLQSYVKAGNMPHLLFAGPAGVGKTTCAMALARDLFGEDWQQNYAETNASVTPDTPCLVRVNSVSRRTTFGELAKEVFGEGDATRKALDGLEILSLDSEFRVRYMPTAWISRHYSSEIVEVGYEGGKVRVSPDHSIVVLEDGGRLVSKAARGLRVGDMLVSFVEALDGASPVLDLDSFSPARLSTGWKNRRNPKLKKVFRSRKLNDRLAWLLGMYLAEGCSSMRPSGTSGGLVWTVGYPTEEAVADKLSHAIEEEFGLSTYRVKGRSGFDRSRESSLQVRVTNTQLARCFRAAFYGRESPRRAPFKRVPSLLFDADRGHRIAFLKGYMGDATGTWGQYVRYSSASEEALVDVAWLARISGLNSSVFHREARIIWFQPSFAYVKGDLIPSSLARELLDRLGMRDNHFLRHSLYGKMSRRISKSEVASYIAKNRLPEEIDETTHRLLSLLFSPLSTARVTSVSRGPYGGHVYDVSVPDSQMFWGGTTPVLLHNSDERGIDVVRQKIKNIARLAPFGNVPFKIIFLDEADNLTADAQAALRRTMETYTKTSRFVLSCNYSSRLIEPIQSRTAVFRFRPLKPEAIREYLARIAKAEKIKITEDGMEALIYVAQGDMRRAVNALQVGASLSSTIDGDILYKAASTVRPEEIRKLIEKSLTGDFLQAREALDKLLIEYGLSGEDVVRQIHRAVFDLNVPDAVKVRLLDRIGETDFRLVEGSNERIQIEALLAHFVLVGQDLGHKK
jgi:replication factor C small subunit